MTRVLIRIWSLASAGLALVALALALAAGGLLVAVVAAHGVSSVSDPPGGAPIAEVDTAFVAEVDVGRVHPSTDGRFLALIRSGLVEEPTEVVVLDAVSGRVVGRHSLDPPLGSVTAEWTAPARLEVRVGGTGEAFDRCAYRLRAHAPDWRFTSLPCDPVRTLDGEQEARGSPLPAGARVHPAVRCDDLPPRLGLKAPGRPLWAVGLCERERGWAGIPEQVPDVLLIDGSGHPIAQLGELRLVGWARDGSLLVTRDERERLLRVPARVIDRLAARRGRSRG